MQKQQLKIIFKNCMLHLHQNIRQLASVKETLITKTAAMIKSIKRGVRRAFKGETVFLFIYSFSRSFSRQKWSVKFCDDKRSIRWIDGRSVGLQVGLSQPNKRGIQDMHRKQNQFLKMIIKFIGGVVLSLLRGRRSVGRRTANDM